MRWRARAVHDSPARSPPNRCATGVATVVAGSDLDESGCGWPTQRPRRGGCFRRCVAAITRDAVVIADPARRGRWQDGFTSGADCSRRCQTCSLQPGPRLAVKCAPGLDFDRLGWLGSRGRFAGRLGARGVPMVGRIEQQWDRRRATVWDQGGPPTPNPTTSRPAARRVHRQPGGAVVRSGLVRHYAADMVSGNSIRRSLPHRPTRCPNGVRVSVSSTAEVRGKDCPQALTRLDCGPLEIMVRGVDVDRMHCESG